MEDNQATAKDDAYLLQMVETIFVQRNQNKWNEIIAACEADDAELAYRLVHTLKGVAAQIGMEGLRQAAAEAEALFRTGNLNIPEELAARLKSELMSELSRREHLLVSVKAGEAAPEPAQVMALLLELEPMLESFDPACFDMVDKLRGIPGMEELSYQIDEYELKDALRTLAGLKEKWQQN